MLTKHTIMSSCNLLTLLKIKRSASGMLYLVIIYPNPHEKLIKVKISLSWNRFDHCSKLFKVKLGQVGICWNQLYLMITRHQFTRKIEVQLDQVEIGSNIEQNHIW